jgi:hypothetical protein
VITLICAFLAAAVAVPLVLTMPGAPLSSPVAGTRLSALIAAPAGFTVDPSKSRDSGGHVLTTPTRPGASPQDISCGAWWAGTSYIGPGDTGYAVKDFTSSDGTTLSVIVNLYRRGGGPAVFDATTALPTGARISRTAMPTACKQARQHHGRRASPLRLPG